MTENGSALAVIPLGGLGEIGGNMMALEFGDEIIVIDAGIIFPDEQLPGVDFAIPDFSYLEHNRDRVRAVLATHGHEDHIGALPYLLARVDAPVFASRLTHGLISVKLREHGLLGRTRLNIAEPGEGIELSPSFGAEFFRVCHSIPDAMGIALTTPLGVAVHTGDFKIDHTPADGLRTDFSRLSQIVGDGAFLLMSDSTYAEVEGYTESERVVGEALDAVVRDARGRVIVATFASLISRIQQVIDAALRYGRKVAVVGRSMINNVRMALEMGYLEAPPDTVIPLHIANRMPLEQVIIVATGSQGEPTSALTRIAEGRHRDIEIAPGDTVAVSASPIPGNETAVARTIDNLMRQGARVLYSRISTVHVHGHAAREELKMMLSVVKPRYFVPVHGERRHLVHHIGIAEDMGVPSERAFALEDGDVLELRENEGGVVDRVESGRLFIDGRRLRQADAEGVEERRRLARDGVVSVSVTLSLRTGLPLATPAIASYGFLRPEESSEIFENLSKRVLDTLDDLSAEPIDSRRMKSRLTRTVVDFLYGETRRRPTALIVIEQV